METVAGLLNPFAPSGMSIWPSCCNSTGWGARAYVAKLDSRGRLLCPGTQAPRHNLQAEIALKENSI